MIVGRRTYNVKIGKLAEFMKLYETEFVPLQLKHPGAVTAGAGMMFLPDFRD